MLPAKTKRFQSIKDEVRDLHPLLATLLPKLPRIIDVEYTQGINEMGADFVMSRRNETFGFTEYVGVVAKAGGIAQDFTDVERQIDECAVPRPFRNGKEDIIIDEIWVVATGYVTKGAQTKIREKYKTRKIVFVDGGRLEKLIDQYVPSFWNEVPLHTAQYLSSVKSSNSRLDTSVSLAQVNGKSFYIEQDIYTFPRLEYRQKMRRLQKAAQKTDIFKAVRQEKLILIEGGWGSGKSKLTRRIIDHFCQPEMYIESQLLPIPISYKDFVDQYDADIEKLIQARVPDPVSAELSKESEFLFLIDGVDEKNLPVEEQISTLRNIAKAIYDNKRVRAVITSRYLKALDESTELSTEVHRYELRSLSLKKTIEFITTICQELNLAGRIIEDLKRSPLFVELPRSPIAAILLAKLISENSKELPSNLPELYSKYVELMLGRWDIEKGLQSQKEYQTLDNILMNWAKYVLENELVYLSVEEAKNFFSDYLKTRNLGLEADALFKMLIERTELMTVDENKGRVAFKHRSFAEFFYAKACLRDRDLHVDERAFQLFWMNTYYFYLGLLKDAPEVLVELSNIQPTTEAERWLKVLNMSNFFMAAYTTPYHVISKGVTDVIKEGAQLYKDTIKTGSLLPIAKLPRMHLLYIFQYLMRYSYSYEFFIPALEEAALAIESSDLDEETKAYALFFLNVAYIDTGAGRSFDFLLKDHSDKLPLDVALAYEHESKDIKNRTALMKKQDKRIKRLIKQNPNLAKTVKEMYENPISSLTKTAKRLEA